ncbi:hypothetical protein [Winogradskyella helgolandensis]|uniref:hypothetical protein n=1 Tax=Winogradskyella helgolandensis TaxID=2697010 RepID=UPI0015BF631E|nr:hypothetical protein [Winogradskyella helgolandensis]
MNDRKLTIEHNTCIISSNLLDELDYVIGGYGKPTIEFIFNFNAFVESYILSSNFILTQRDFEHINITRKVLFPNGRPILDLLIKAKNVSSVSGFGNNITQCVYVDKVEKNDERAGLKAVEAFCKRDSERIKSNFILSDFSNPIKSVKTYSLGFTGKDQDEFGNKSQVLIGETTNQPFEIVKSLFNTITNHNVQAALPVFTYKEQFNELGKKAISKEIYTTISEIQGQKIDDAEKHFGSELQSIPPLVSIVLSKVKNREEIPKVLKEIREDFTEFRNCCEKFEKTLNEATTIKEQLDAIKEYKKFWSVLVKKYSDDTSRIMFRFLDVAKESDYENAIDNVIDTQSADELFKDLNLGKVAGKAGFLAWDKIKEKRILNKFKGVVNLWSLLENSPTIDSQIKDIERVFETTINRKRLLIAKDYLKKIKTVPNTVYN